MAEEPMPITTAELLDILGECQDFGPTYDGLEGDQKSWLDAWYNFDAITRLLNQRLGLTDRAKPD